MVRIYIFAVIVFAAICSERSAIKKVDTTINVYMYIEYLNYTRKNYGYTYSKSVIINY